MLWFERIYKTSESGIFAQDLRCHSLSQELLAVRWAEPGSQSPEQKLRNLFVLVIRQTVKF